MRLLRFVLLGAAVIAASPAGAQTTYRWVDPANGLTVFSDKPPPPGARQVVKMSGDEAAGEAKLPYATQLAVDKFPVTLYTGASCVEVCQQARDLLNGRGVPFSEKILSSQGITEELKLKLGGEVAVPSLIIGQQSFRGFEATAWTNLLDLAGYPKSAPYGVKLSGAFAK